MGSRTASTSASGGNSCPPWVAHGKRLRWWSQSQQKFVFVLVSKVDEAKRHVVVTFEADKKVWKSVPFSKLGLRDCPLQDMPEAGRDKDKDKEKTKGKKESGKDSKDAATSRGGTSDHGKKNPDAEDGSRTPDWWSQEKKRMLDGSAVQQKIKEHEQKEKKELDKEKQLKEERRRKELVEKEKRKVEEAFEKRKREAEALKLKEEEEWRENLRKRREREAAEEAEKEKEREER